MHGAISYLDFDLLVRRTEGGYRAQVLSSPAGEATADFAAPFSELELENFLLRVGRPRRGTRRIGSPEMEAVKTLGKGLYEAIFSGDVRACWRSSLSEAEAQSAGLRLRLRIADAPELNDIPWEYLYNASLNRFLSLSEYTPLIRYLDLPERIRPLEVDSPLKILVMISSPADYPALDVEGEWSRLNKALAGLIGSGQVRLERLATPRLSVLQRKLRGDEFHILHFVGHAGFDRETQDGILVLCDEAGKGRLVAAENLGTILHDHRSLRLVVLNACEGSRSSRSDPFAGVAQTLVQQGVPAVIAMQFEITDEAAITFAEEFYAATADGYPVDAALSASRKAIFAAGNDIEWGTPVLYLRAPNGQIFTVNRDAEAARLAAEEKQRAEAARLAEEEEKERAEAARLAEEEKQRAEAAWLAVEEKQRQATEQLYNQLPWHLSRRAQSGISIAGVAIALLGLVLVPSQFRYMQNFSWGAVPVVALLASATVFAIRSERKWAASVLAGFNSLLAALITVWLVIGASGGANWAALGMFALFALAFAIESVAACLNLRGRRGPSRVTP
jgi:CHAT domain-containing protein